MRTVEDKLNLHKIEPVDKVSCISLPQFQTTRHLHVDADEPYDFHSRRLLCIAGKPDLHMYIRSIYTGYVLYTRYTMHVGIQKSVILREGYAVFYVIQEAKRRIISLRASKSEAPSYRMTDRCVYVREGSGTVRQDDRNKRVRFARMAHSPCQRKIPKHRCFSTLSWGRKLLPIPCGRGCGKANLYF